jgi:hypothetical protein
MGRAPDAAANPSSRTPSPRPPFHKRILRATHARRPRPQEDLLGWGGSQRRRPLKEAHHRGHQGARARARLPSPSPTQQPTHQRTQTALATRHTATCPAVPRWVHRLRPACGHGEPNPDPLPTAPFRPAPPPPRRAPPRPQASLNRMGVDYVDVLFAHRPDPNTPIEETVRAFNHCIDQARRRGGGGPERSAARGAARRAAAQLQGCNLGRRVCSRGGRCISQAAVVSVGCRAPNPDSAKQTAPKSWRTACHTRLAGLGFLLGHQRVERGANYRGDCGRVGQCSTEPDPAGPRLYPATRLPYNPEPGGPTRTIQTPKAWAVADRLDLIGPCCEQPQYNVSSRPGGGSGLPPGRSPRPAVPCRQAEGLAGARRARPCRPQRAFAAVPRAACGLWPTPPRAPATETRAAV